ncbi:hypothetical protein NMU67_06650, partial [Pasteurella multocida]|nr:hypothetical protein [Pasteurella multocida]
MVIQKRPDEKVFASQAKNQEVSEFPDVERGWGFTFEQTGGIPTMEHFNALFKRIDEHFNYMLQRGLPEWSATLDYPVGAYVQYDNKTYRSKKASKNQRPDIVDSAYWARWSIDYKEVSDIAENRFSSLANADGYKHVGRCKSVEMLRKVVPSKHGQRILVDAYYEGGTTGGGEFVADLQDLTTADDGGSCFVVLNNTARWKRI